MEVKPLGKQKTCLTCKWYYREYQVIQADNKILTSDYQRSKCSHYGEEIPALPPLMVLIADSCKDYRYFKNGTK